jgi:hypothetical protein
VKFDAAHLLENVWGDLRIKPALDTDNDGRTDGFTTLARGPLDAVMQTVISVDENQIPGPIHVIPTDDRDPYDASFPDDVDTFFHITDLRWNPPATIPPASCCPTTVLMHPGRLAQLL